MSDTDKLAWKDKMAKTVLLAVRPQEKEVVRSIIQQGNHRLIIAGPLSDVTASYGKKQFQVAVIDEDFDGPSTGWTLAERIRESSAPSVKIVILVRGDYHTYYDSRKSEGKFDWIMGFPISSEQLLHELERKWPISG